MNLDQLGNLLEATLQYQKLRECLSSKQFKDTVQIIPTALPFALSKLWRDFNNSTLVITPSAEDAQRLYEQLLFWNQDDLKILHFPDIESLPFEHQVSDMHIIYQRLHTLSCLINSPKSPLLIISSVSAIAHTTLDKNLFGISTHIIQKGEKIDVQKTLDMWRRIGYKFESIVSTPGTVSTRGGIIDIFPVGDSFPARIELMGNEIDSLRVFDPSTQISTNLIDQLIVCPSNEILPGMLKDNQLNKLISQLDLSNCNTETQIRLSEELTQLSNSQEVECISFYSGLFNHSSLLDYFPKDGLIVLNKPTEIETAILKKDQRIEELRTTKENRGELPKNFPSNRIGWDRLKKTIASRDRNLHIISSAKERANHQKTHILPLAPSLNHFGKLKNFVDDSQRLAKQNYIVIAMTSVPKRLREIFQEFGITTNIVSSLEEIPLSGSITILQQAHSGISEGYLLTNDSTKLAIFSDTEIFGFTKKRQVLKRKTSRQEISISELTLGDYVVHVEHGIGKFSGVGNSPRSSNEKEYLILEYSAGDKLYVPMEHLDRVSPYVAPMDRPPVLTRLGTQEWHRTKQKVEKSTREMASELISLYAARELTNGHAFSSDTPWQAELEDSFPYEETPDQKETIAEIKSDMEKIKPMDRLICGDVGYGKTEIALRAIFKTVMDGKQAVLLVPTTVLAQQHYATFSERLSAYPVTIEVLSRFRTTNEQQKVVAGLASGEIDICIGTHRLIQNDIQIKDLGLVVIDEEQRFGVAHKEKLKQLRHEVDVLTMTATPIPRTLHLSLAGIRDMSTIDTPPEERLPIKTYVSEFSDEIIRQAIQREIDREGQVYFLHNRVYNIVQMANYISKLIPEAKVGIAHGQMPETKLENSMIELSEGKINVLVCTTIIESGLDIPNVNTLIINRADTLGLSQLYQLRGRVGRSARRAYSYLLTPPIKALTQTSQKRLETMISATELGSGFRIAMKDLEIRGAGNILGTNQSGHIHAVGFALYSSLLGEAVNKLQSQNSTTNNKLVELHENNPEEGKSSFPHIDLGIPASIPEKYISDLHVRLNIYRRFIDIISFTDLDAMVNEMEDRFGTIPDQVQNLLYIIRLKVQSKDSNIKSIIKNKSSIIIQLNREIGDAKKPLEKSFSEDVTLGHSQIRINLTNLHNHWQTKLLQTVETIAEFQKRMLVELYKLQEIRL